VKFDFNFAGSGKDEYSSSTQKQSIDTVTTSRNTSLKHYKLKSSYADNILTSPPLLESSALYALPDEDSEYHDCLTTKVTHSKMNILSDCNINEIHLNIFPPSATYVKEALNTATQGVVYDDHHNYLNIDVHERLNPKAIRAGKEASEGKRKTSIGYFPHISVKRCDSLLHISIGNSSKITKRQKKNSWLFAKFFRLPFKRKSTRRGCFLTPEKYKDDSYRLSNGSLNLINEVMMISINRHRSRQAPVNVARHHENFPKDNDNDIEIENGANELDFYMNEIKRREMSSNET
jgi:hypothetical protein